MHASSSHWPEEVYRDSAAAIGGACAVLLLTEAQWVHRRVETIDVLSTELSRRRTSVDFTVPAPIRASLRVSDRAVVPIATLGKQPLRHFDLRDESGRAVPILGRDQNGDVAHFALLRAAEYAMQQANAGSLTPRTVADLRAIATGDPGEATQTLGSMMRAAEQGDQELGVLLEDGWFFFLVALLAENYVLLATVESLEGRRILKFAYDEALEDSRSIAQRLRQGLGSAALTFSFEAPAAGRTSSYHAELVVPEELRIEAAVLYDLDDLSIYGDPDEDADRGALYASHLGPWTQPAIFVHLRAERAGLPTVAFVVGVITAVLLVLGAVVFEPKPETGGPPIAVLLAGSAFFAGAVAHRGEHNLVRRFFGPLRFVLVLVALTAVLAAATLAFNASTHTIDVVWKASAATTAVLASILGYAYKRAVPISRASRNQEPA